MDHWSDDSIGSHLQGGVIYDKVIEMFHTKRAKFGREPLNDLEPSSSQHKQLMTQRYGSIVICS